MQWSKLQPGYGIVHRSVLQMKTISRGAKLLYALLCSYANKEGQCFPSEETMAADLQMTSRGIRKWLGELTFKGMVLKKLTNTVPAHNVYQVLYPTDSTEPAFRSGRNRGSYQGGTGVPSKSTKEKKNNGESPPPLVGAAPRTREDEQAVAAMSKLVPWRRAGGG